MVKWNKEPVDVDVEIHQETPKAFLVWNGDEDKDGQPIKTWLPKSQVTNNGDGTITMPEWLAIDKGMV